MRKLRVCRPDIHTTVDSLEHLGDLLDEFTIEYVTLDALNITVGGDGDHREQLLLQAIANDLCDTAYHSFYPTVERYGNFSFTNAFDMDQ